MRGIVKRLFERAVDIVMPRSFQTLGFTWRNWIVHRREPTLSEKGPRKKALVINYLINYRVTVIKQISIGQCRFVLLRGTLSP